MSSSVSSRFQQSSKHIATHQPGYFCFPTSPGEGPLSPGVEQNPATSDFPSRCFRFLAGESHSAGVIYRVFPPERRSQIPEMEYPRRPPCQANCLRLRRGAGLSPRRVEVPRGDASPDGMQDRRLCRGLSPSSTVSLAAVGDCSPRPSGDALMDDVIPSW